MQLRFERSKQNPPVPYFDHFLYAHLVFQAMYCNLHFLSTHWNNRRLLEPRGTSEAVLYVNIIYSNQALCSHILQIQFYVSSVDSIKTQPPVYTSEPFLTNSTFTIMSIKVNWSKQIKKRWMVRVRNNSTWIMSNIMMLQQDWFYQGRILFESIN